MSRRKTWWGLAAILALGILGVIYLSGVLPLPHGQKEKKPLCWVSPQNPNYIKEAPGKDPEGNELVPVYPTQPPAQGPAVAPTAPALAPAPAPAPAPPTKRKIKYWVSPMDPGYIRDKPGKAPCGMDLVPVYEEVDEAAGGPGAISVSPATIQSMGVRTAKVEIRPLHRVTVTVGLVTYDERNLAVINTKVNGWVEQLYVNATGDPVRKGQTLLSIYSPELVSAQEEYLLAWKNYQTLGKSPVKEMAEGARRLLEASRRRLQYFDISPSQIQALKTTDQVKKNLILTSPANGIVTKRLVTQGMYVRSGMSLLEVADLSNIWVDAEIYQYELPWIRVGQPVTMTLEYLPGETFAGAIDYIYPYLKEATRTAKVRLKFPNPQLKLKPEMFAQVKIESPVAKEAVVVPTEAVLDTGLQQHVFLALGQGRFEPREVKLGVYGDGNSVREVLSGLKGGEDVVVSAQFLLDSESRFREAVQMMMPGMKMETGKEGGAPAAMPAMKMEAPPATPPPAPTPPGAGPPSHKH
jgi:RND family efflux transporter MFP subunit